MDVLFVTSVAPIVRDAEASRSFYADALGLNFEGEDGDYMFTHNLEGTKHFGLWPLSEAANACFGTAEWPRDIPPPQASIEFEVADVASAAEELTARGYRLIHDARTEPWGQITARLLSPEGLLVAVCFSPTLHET
jgi:catechol 2,3-dioxygenase-like lactoylglutathione lyase family enzyme